MAAQVQKEDVFFLQQTRADKENFVWDLYDYWSFKHTRADERVLF